MEPLFSFAKNVALDDDCCSDVLTLEVNVDEEVEYAIVALELELSLPSELF